MRKQKGFSLIELLIVVAIILIIAAIAIPNLLRARIAANESSAVSSIRTVNTAEISYQAAYPTVGYATTGMSTLGPATKSNACATPNSTNACLIDYAVSNASTAALAKSGYYFALGTGSSGDANSYLVAGSAAKFNQTGVRNFCSVEDGVVRFDNVGSSTLIASAATCLADANLN